MSFLTVIIAIIIVGVLLWAVNSFIPMDGKVKGILNAIVIIVLILWLLQVFGVLGTLGNIRVN